MSRRQHGRLPTAAPLLDPRALARSGGSEAQGGRGTAHAHVLEQPAQRQPQWHSGLAEGSGQVAEQLLKLDKPQRRASAAAAARAAAAAGLHLGEELAREHAERLLRTRLQPLAVHRVHDQLAHDPEPRDSIERLRALATIAKRARPARGVA
jgi:hypothetical protein